MVDVLEINSPVPDYQPQDRADPRHIVDILIEERARSLTTHPLLWLALKRVLYPMLKYHDAVVMADKISTMGGYEALGWLSQTLNIKTQIKGAHHIPRQGRVMVVANHPTGIADGIAVYQALSPLRPDLAFFANGDAIRVSPTFLEALIPIEWVAEKRSITKTRLMLGRTNEAFAAEQAVVMFPSGRLAYLGARGLIERPWFSSTITMMRKHNVPILPLHIRAHNSPLFYALAILSGQLRDITLFNEMLNKGNQLYRLEFGPIIMPDDLTGSPVDAIANLRDYVSREMPLGRPSPTADK